MSFGGDPLYVKCTLVAAKGERWGISRAGLSKGWDVIPTFGGSREPGGSAIRLFYGNQVEII